LKFWNVTVTVVISKDTSNIRQVVKTKNKCLQQQTTMSSIYRIILSPNQYKPALLICDFLYIRTFSLVQPKKLGKKNTWREQNGYNRKCL